MTGLLAEALPMQRPCHEELSKHLLGPGVTGSELPPLTDLLAVLLALAEGTRRKALLPLASSTGEFAFVRRGEQVLVSYYDGGPVPQIFVRDRPLELAELLAVASAAAIEQSTLASSTVNDPASLLIVERAQRAIVKPDPQPAPVVVKRQAGALEPPRDAPLAFGFSAKLTPGEGHAIDAGTRADVHALLFDGELWSFAHGRRIPLVRGPIFPAIVRMISATRRVVEAWEAQRPISLKLKAGEFGIALGLDRQGAVRVTLAGPSGEALTLPALDLSTALLPILRVASDLARTVVATDRAQSKNLRLCALRDEVRALRRIVRTRSVQKSFVNRDPELLRASALGLPRERDLVTGVGSLPASSGGLRLSLRWRAEVDGLDAASTFLCGDRIVLASPRAQLALAREDGELLWMRESSTIATFMAGTALLCASADGELTLSDLEDGEVYARTRIAPRTGGPMLGLFAGARGTPPLAVLTEGRDRLVAVDARTGAARWRFRAHSRGDFRLTRAGRILLVVSGDSSLDAIDVATGEVAWRWSDLDRMSLSPSVTRERAIAVASQGSGASALLCFDLFSGQCVFRRELEASPVVSPVATEQLAIVSSHQGTQLTLTAYELADGKERWRVRDPGLGEGGAALVVDQSLVINAPSGCAHALDLATGERRWEQRLADPTRDDVPRRLEPVLRGGALFLPSANVHVVRPHDGSLIGGPVADRIIPDFMRVDERGWLYVAEESGIVEAHAPIPTLRLVKS